MPFVLRAATVDDIDGDRLRAIGATRVDAIVLDSNDLGQNLWQASGYSRKATGVAG